MIRLSGLGRPTVKAGSALPLAALVFASLVVSPGCDSSSQHVADPAAAAKTLTDPDTTPPVKSTGKKKVQQFAEQYRQEVAKHPKIR